MSASEHGSDLDVLLRDVYDEPVSPRTKPVQWQRRRRRPHYGTPAAQPHYGTDADRVRAAQQERQAEHQARIAAELSANQHQPALKKLQREQQAALTKERHALATANAATAAAKDEAARAKQAAARRTS